MRNRQTKYDYLRTISCVAVVMLHVAAMYVKSDFIDIVPWQELQWASFYRTIVQLAVPSFVMLSGAFLINDRNAEYKSFYKRMLHRIIIPTLIFSILYVIFHYAENYAAFFMGIMEEPVDRWEPLKNWLNGQPNVTMWYMYMIIGLYVVTPVLVRIKQSIPQKTYFRLGCVLFLYSILVAHTCNLSWILQFMQWIGYFVLGNVIYDYASQRTFGKTGYFLIALSYFILSLYWLIYSFGEGRVNIPGSFSAVVLVGTVLQFVGFSMLPNSNSIDKVSGVLSEYSLEIYLIHPLICEVYMQMFGRIFKRFLPAQLIPVYTIIIVALSCAAGVFLAKAMKKFRAEK